jgi:hypothetical protein
MKEPTEFGICLNDEAFDAFGEELLEDVDCAACRPVVEQKKFEGDRPACPDFQEAECIEIDDDSPLGRRLKELAEEGELTSETLEEILLEERIRQTDWTTLPVDTYAEQLEEGSPEERKSAMKSLEGLAALGNEAAFDALRAYLASLPPPGTIEEVHLKRDVLRRLDRGGDRASVARVLIADLQAVPSNNTTRQWISAIFKFLARCPLNVIREPLEAMLENKKLSPRFRKKVQETLLRSRGFQD